MFVTWFQTKKNALTLAMLAGEGRSLCRAWLNEQIWPESNRNDERRNLRVALTWLRKNLPVPAGSDLFVEHRDTIQIHPDAIITDIHVFETALAAARAELQFERKKSLLEQAAGLYRGPFLEGLRDYGESTWLESRRHRFEVLYLEALQLLVNLHEARHEWRPALDYALRALQTNPESEGHRAAAIRLSLRVGDWSYAAMHQRAFAPVGADVAQTGLAARLGALVSHVDQVERSNQLPTITERDALQQSINAALTLLRPDDRLFLLRLSVFPAPFTAEEAAVVLEVPDAGTRLKLLETYSLIIGPRELEKLTDGVAETELFRLPETQRRAFVQQLNPEDVLLLQRRHAEMWRNWAVLEAKRYTISLELPDNAHRSRYRPHLDAVFTYLLEHDFTSAKTLIAPVVGLFQEERLWAREHVRSVLRHPELSDSDWDTIMLGNIEMVQGTGTSESICDLQRLIEWIRSVYDETPRPLALATLVRGYTELGSRAHHHELDELAAASLREALRLCEIDPLSAEAERFLREVAIRSRLCDSLMVQGKTLESRRSLEKSLTLLEMALGEPDVRQSVEALAAVVQYQYGSTLATQGEYRGAAEAIGRSLEYNNQHKILHSEADCLIKLGSINLVRGNRTEARILTGQAVTFYTNIGAQDARAAALGSLGDVFARLGLKDRALSCYEEGLGVWRERGHRRWQAVFNARMAMFACDQGECERALSLAADVRAFCRVVRSWSSLATAARVEGICARRCGDEVTAAERFKEALREYRDAAYWLGTIEIIEELAALALTGGNVASARLLTSIADRERETHEIPRPAGELAGLLTNLHSAVGSRGGKRGLSRSKPGLYATLEDTVRGLLQQVG